MNESLTPVVVVNNIDFTVEKLSPLEVEKMKYCRFTNISGNKLSLPVFSADKTSGGGKVFVTFDPAVQSDIGIRMCSLGANVDELVEWRERVYKLESEIAEKSKTIGNMKAINRVVREDTSDLSSGLASRYENVHSKLQVIAGLVSEYKKSSFFDKVKMLCKLLFTQSTTLENISLFDNGDDGYDKYVVTISSKNLEYLDITSVVPVLKFKCDRYDLEARYSRNMELFLVPAAIRLCAGARKKLNMSIPGDVDVYNALKGTVLKHLTASERHHNFEKFTMQVNGDLIVTIAKIRNL